MNKEGPGNFSSKGAGRYNNAVGVAGPATRTNKKTLRSNRLLGARGGADALIIAPELDVLGHRPEPPFSSRPRTMSSSGEPETEASGL